MIVCEYINFYKFILNKRLACHFSRSLQTEKVIVDT